MEKILINENRGQALAFEASVEKAVRKLNELIAQFHQYQQWQKIESESDFLKLIGDPVAYFDQVMINNSGINASTKLNPEVVAQLLNVDRDSWLTYLNGKLAAGSSDYEFYRDYLIFREGKIYPDAEAIKTKQQTFAVYATTPVQVKIVLALRDLVDNLNWLMDENICNGIEVETAATALRLFYSRDTGRVMPPDPIMLTNLISGR